MTTPEPPPLHPQARALLEALADLGDPPIQEDTPDAARARRRSRIVPSTIAVREIRDLDAGGVPARLYRPRADAGQGLLVWFRGGGWVLGDLDTHDDLCRSLATRSEQAVLSVDYRLAPEHPFPAALTDALVAVRWARAHAPELGCDPGRLAVGGDSAGGNLAAVVAQLAPVPLRFQLLIYPVTDARGDHPSYAEHAADGFLTAAAMRWFVDQYLSGTQGSPDDPRVSPLLADDTALAAGPPALVITADVDPLRDEGEAYATRLAAAGVPTSLTRYLGTYHGFVSLASFLDDGRAAQAQAAELLRLALA